MGLVGRFLLPAIALRSFVASHPTGSEVARRALDEDAISRPEVVNGVDEAGNPAQTIYYTVTTTLESPAVASQTLGYSPVTMQTPPSPSAAAETTNYSAVVSQTPHSAVTVSSQPYNQASQGSSYSSPGQAHNVQPATSSRGNGTNPAGTKFFGIAYAPYRADHECKSPSEINQDFKTLGQYYSMVRIYGTACDQVSNVLEAAKAYNMKVFLGIWDPINDLENEVKLIRDGVKGDWEIVHTVSVGNEMVNSNQAGASDVAAAVAKARASLRDVGFNGPVVTVDTFGAYQRNAELAEASDYCAVNAHPYFDSTVSADKAGEWLRKTIENISCPNSKNVIVTETGWPTQGTTNGLAVPSPEQQATALRSIDEAFSNGLSQIIHFSAFNDKWKSPGNLNVEQYWGIHDNSL